MVTPTTSKSRYRGGLELLEAVLVGQEAVAAKLGKGAGLAALVTWAVMEVVRGACALRTPSLLDKKACTEKLMHPDSQTCLSRSTGAQEIGSMLPNRHSCPKQGCSPTKPSE